LGARLAKKERKKANCIRKSTTSWGRQGSERGRTGPQDRGHGILCIPFALMRTVSHYRKKKKGEGGMEKDKGNSWSERELASEKKW